VLSSWDDVQVRIGEVAHNASSDRDRTQWVAVAPERENRDLNSLQLRSQVRTEEANQSGSCGFWRLNSSRQSTVPSFAVSIPPEVATKTRCVMKSCLRRAALTAITPHRLSDQCRRAVYPRHYVVHQIFEAGN
jgi:hypothetical protein